jgi:hypothetical protein
MEKASALLDRFLEPVRESLTPAQARRLLEFKADEGLQAKIDELARKANNSSLTEEERAKYEAFVEAGDLIAMLQATARDVLKGSMAASC